MTKDEVLILIANVLLNRNIIVGNIGSDGIYLNANKLNFNTILAITTIITRENCNYTCDIVFGENGIELQLVEKDYKVYNIGSNTIHCKTKILEYNILMDIQMLLTNNEPRYEFDIIISDGFIITIKDIEDLPF